MGKIRVSLKGESRRVIRSLAKFRYGKGRRNRNKLVKELALRFVEGEGGHVSDAAWKGLKRTVGGTDLALFKEKEARRINSSKM